MNNNVFIIPGYHDSGPAHWQSWLQSRLPDTSRLLGVDWHHPDLTAWADQAHRQLDGIATPVWLVAHSFGCLVTAVVAAERPEQIAGILFVAPADPQRFSIHGGIRNTRDDNTPHPAPSVSDILPETLPLAVSSAVIASENDPWLSFPNALAMSNRWRSHFVNLGEAGHINTDAGFGPWPGLQRQLARLRHEKIPDFSLLNRHSLERGAIDADEQRDNYYPLWKNRKTQEPAIAFAF